MAQHTRAGCPERLTETFWLPSYCRGCLAAVSDRLDAMTDAEAVSWDGTSRYCTASYVCHCCDMEWSESDWPVCMLLGPSWRSH
ncbi:MAG TPA: hypothetical protein VE400_12285 [Mycobacterium sp.]|nr:hypothetical protein [Mycobacterium sp.]